MTLVELAKEKLLAFATGGLRHPDLAAVVAEVSRVSWRGGVDEWTTLFVRDALKFCLTCDDGDGGDGGVTDLRSVECLYLESERMEWAAWAPHRPGLCDEAMGEYENEGRPGTTMSRVTAGMQYELDGVVGAVTTVLEDALEGT